MPPFDLDHVLPQCHRCNAGIAAFLAVAGRLSAVPFTVGSVLWAILFPIIFYPYCCALWIALDHVLHPPTPAELAGQRPDNDVASPLSAMRGRRRDPS